MRGYTVEMAFLMPMILLIFMGSIFGVFYYHDKNIIAGAAYETAVVGSTKAREKKGTDVQELQTLFQDRVDGKCILFSGADAEIEVNEKEITVSAKASAKGMRLSVMKKAVVTKPEQRIRDVRRIKELGNGTQNDN